jgi:hypothetical protein
MSRRARIFRRILLGSLLALLILIAATTWYGWRIIDMPGRSYNGPLPPLTSRQIELRDDLRRHVTTLAGDLGERSYRRPDALHAAADYIARNFREMDLHVTIQSVTDREVRMDNIIAQLPASAPDNQILIVGAHYDSVYASPGADDNASAVAALLEIARLCAGRQFPRTLRFVCFFNEEGYGSPIHGNRLYAAHCRQQNDNIVGMISLEMLGYYTDSPNSQRYPFPFSLFYPSTGNFIAFVGNSASRPFIHQSIAAFRANARFPSRGAAAPDWLPDAGRSDHAAFWAHGYPGLMVTDTANFRNPHYHRPTDTPETLDYDRLARVTTGLADMVQTLGMAR